jgi:hypothetical protein
MHNDLAESFLTDFVEDAPHRTATLNWPTVYFSQFGAYGPTKVIRTGSRFIDEGNPNNKDFDFLCAVPNLEKFWALALGFDYVCQEDLWDDADFMSFRKDEVNLIVTDKSEFFTNFELATNVARELKLDTRQKRVCLFQSILYGKFKTLGQCNGGYFGN